LELQAMAAQDATAAHALLLNPHLDHESIQASIRQLGERGIPPTDLIRAAQETESRILALAEEQLADQPDLHLELIHRIQHLGSSYRTNVTAIQIDDTLRRLQERMA